MVGRRNSMTPSVNTILSKLLIPTTHIHGHTLDVVCVRDTLSKVACPKVSEGLSDHLAIKCSVNVPIDAPCKFRQVNTQKIHKINITDFREDILNYDLIEHPHMTASLLSHQYFCTLHNILDKHVPIKRKVVPLHPDKASQAASKRLMSPPSQEA